MACWKIPAQMILPLKLPFSLGLFRPSLMTPQMRAESSPGYVREPERAPRPGAELLRVLKCLEAPANPPKRSINGSWKYGCGSKWKT